MAFTPKHIVLLNCLLLFLYSGWSFAGKPPPSIKQCKSKWTLTNGSSLAFGSYSIDSGSGTINISSGGALTASGDIGLSGSQPATTNQVTVDNTRGPICANYGFTLNWGAAPQPLAGPGTALNLNAFVYEPTIAPTAGATFPIVVAPNSGLTLPFTLTIYGNIATSFPQTAGAYTSPLFDVGVTQSGTNTLSAGTTATATSLTPISLLEVVPMDFGTVAGSSTASTVILDTVGARTTTGGAQTLPAGPSSAASFQITGSASQTYILTMSASATLESSGGQQMTISSFVNNSSGTIPASGIENFAVGGTLNLNAAQAAGTYSTTIGAGSPYSVTVNYN